MDEKTKRTLIAAYRHSQGESSPGEKAAAQAQFERLCKRKGVDPKRVILEAHAEKPDVRKTKEEGVKDHKAQEAAKKDASDRPASRRRATGPKPTGRRPPPKRQGRKKQPGWVTRKIDAMNRWLVKKFGKDGAKRLLLRGAGVACGVAGAAFAKSLGVFSFLAEAEPAGEMSGWDDKTGKPRK